MKVLNKQLVNNVPYAPLSFKVGTFCVHKRFTVQLLHTTTLELAWALIMGGMRTVASPTSALLELF